MLGTKRCCGQVWGDYETDIAIRASLLIHSGMEWFEAQREAEKLEDLAQVEETTVTVQRAVAASISGSGGGVKAIHVPAMVEIIKPQDVPGEAVRPDSVEVIV